MRTSPQKEAVDAEMNTGPEIAVAPRMAAVAAMERVVAGKRKPWSKKWQI